MKWLFKYYWGLLLVGVIAIIVTVIPFIKLYLGLPEDAIARWNNSPLEAICGRALFAFIPTFIVTLLLTIIAFLTRRFLFKDKVNSTIIYFGKTILFFSFIIILMISFFLVLEYFHLGHIV
jgi:hypothetical protein